MTSSPPTPLPITRNEGENVNEQDPGPILLPCPFCGGEPEADHVETWTGQRMVLVGGRFRHHCGGGARYFYMECRGLDITDAAANWNRRAQPARKVLTRAEAEDTKP